ncbi:transposase [Legionella waltersii]|uniref:Transposase IS200 like protein n=1 Tax=Legionella waltersii TaxID=66969 RepID=A0A0W1ABW8_9GAMM|nr:transposase [Legionella waltersii]KTD78811.1 Transposase IS200 like protein [Legionella waltersii]SNV11021.1 Transposase and inactivated derivatives [Legionella waltersii]
MPRKPRVVSAGQPHHLIQRGNNRQNIFNLPKDYNYFLQKLYEASFEHDCEVHAYVLMTNHTHMLVTPKNQEDLAKMMRKLGTSYVSYFNYNYERTGSLLEGRYKSAIISDDLYFLICMRYIELNPVRAHISKHPSDYEWSSYHANAMGQKSTIITPHPLFLSLANNEEERYELYKDLFSIPLSKKDIKRILSS